MQIITITSDWNKVDYYAAALKGRILNGCPTARIIDISHQVKSFNTAQAAYLVRNAYKNFPEGTIHIIAVNSEPGSKGHLLAAKLGGQYFLCADNGVLGLLGDPEPEQVIWLTRKREDTDSSFIALTVFAKVACDLAGGTSFSELGSPAEFYDKQVPLRPAREKNVITGSVIHVDSYQNSITNITREFFEKAGRGRAFVIYLQSRHYTLDKINTWYNESPEGEILALFNAAGLLEIAIRNGNAAGLLNLKINATIRIEFKEG